MDKQELKNKINSLIALSAADRREAMKNMMKEIATATGTEFVEVKNDTEFGRFYEAARTGQDFSQKQADWLYDSIVKFIG